MRFLLLLVCLFIFQNNYSQDYTPMLYEGKSWEMEMINYYPVGGGATVYTYYSHYIEGTAVFNDINYQILHNTNPDFYTHYLREDTTNKTIYEYYPNTDTERILFDFDIVVGDSFSCTFEFDEYILCEDVIYSSLVTEIGTIELYGINRKYYKVDFIDEDDTVINTHTIIEGFGFSIEGLFSSQCPYPPTDIPGISVMNMNSMSISDNAYTENKDLFYNSIQHQLALKNTKENKVLTLFSTLGKKVFSSKIMTQVDVSLIPNGFYLYQLTSKNGFEMGKILIY